MDRQGLAHCAYLPAFDLDLSPDRRSPAKIAIFGHLYRGALDLEYDALNLRIEGINRLPRLYHYLKFVYARPRRTYRIIPRAERPYIEQMVYDLATDRFLGMWQDGDFDFAGADDEVVERLDTLFRAHLPLSTSTYCWMDEN